MNTSPAPPSPFDLIPRQYVRAFRMPKSQYLFHQGKPPAEMFYLLHGSASLLRHTPCGQVVPIHRASASEMIAEASMFSGTYHCDCKLEQDSHILGFRKSAVLELLDTQPKFSAQLVKRLAIQIQRYRRQLELRSIQSAQERVLAGLSDGWFNATVIAFASDMGLSPEATYRALSKLVADGVVQKTGRGKYAVTGAEPPPAR